MILNAILLTCSTALLITAITALHRARRHCNEAIRLLTTRTTAEDKHRKDQLRHFIADLKKQEPHERTWYT